MMPRPNDSHERLADGGRPASGSARAFGAVFAFVFAVVGAIPWIRGGDPPAWPFVVSGAFLVAALLTPELLAPLSAARAKLSPFGPIVVSGACLIARSLAHCFYPAPPPHRYEFRRICCVIWWNILLLTVGLLLAAGAGEAYLRLNAPYFENSFSMRFLPAVGYAFEPNTETRFTNRLDYWTTERTNSLGFLDREPPDPGRAATGCSVMAIGDSFVVAREVPIEDKFHVQLEETANLEYPALNVTTSAFGLAGLAQTQQLPLYDEYAPRLRPNLVALVFTHNDFRNNSPVLMAMEQGRDPEYLPFASARNDADGTIRLSPPSKESRFWATQETPIWLRILRYANRESSFVRWAKAKLGLYLVDKAKLVASARQIERRPGYESFLDGWNPSDVDFMTGFDPLTEFFIQPELPPTFQEALLFTAFALDEFQRRAERDGAALVILATHMMGPAGSPLSERLAAMAGERGIPVINQYDYIERVGGNVEDAHFRHDWHWSPQGHQWAAEALMEWLRENSQVCADE